MFFIVLYIIIACVFYIAGKGNVGGGDAEMIHFVFSILWPMLLFMILYTLITGKDW